MDPQVIPYQRSPIKAISVVSLDAGLGKKTLVVSWFSHPGSSSTVTLLVGKSGF